MKDVRVLIDLARDLVGTDAELARKTGLTRMQINDMRAGRKPVSPETVALLCQVLKLDGEKAREWLAISVVSNPKNAEKVGVLRKAFFVTSAVGAVLLPLSHTNDAITSDTQLARQTSELTKEDLCAARDSRVHIIDGIYIVAVGLLRRAFNAVLRALRTHPTEQPKLRVKMLA